MECHLAPPLPFPPIPSCRSFGRSFRPLVGVSGGRTVGQSVGRQVKPYLGRSVRRACHLAHWLVGWLVGSWSVSRFHLVVSALGRSALGRSVGRSACQCQSLAQDADSQPEDARSARHALTPPRPMAPPLRPPGSPTIASPGQVLRRSGGSADLTAAMSSAASSVGGDPENKAARVKPPSHWLAVLQPATIFDGQSLKKQVDWAEGCKTRMAKIDTAEAECSSERGGSDWVGLDQGWVGMGWLGLGLGLGWVGLV